ncbi:hypothetical protein Tco_0738572 [Tanacetum coccineum]
MIPLFSFDAICAACRDRLPGIDAHVNFLTETVDERSNLDGEIWLLGWDGRETGVEDLTRIKMASGADLPFDGFGGYLSSVPDHLNNDWALGGIGSIKQVKLIVDADVFLHNKNMAVKSGVQRHTTGPTPLDHSVSRRPGTYGKVKTVQTLHNLDVDDDHNGRSTSQIIMSFNHYEYMEDIPSDDDYDDDDMECKSYVSNDGAHDVDDVNFSEKNLTLY